MVQSGRQVANRSKLYGTLQDSLNNGGGGPLVYACFLLCAGINISHLGRAHYIVITSHLPTRGGGGGGVWLSGGEGS